MGEPVDPIRGMKLERRQGDRRRAERRAEPAHAPGSDHRASNLPALVHAAPPPAVEPSPGSVAFEAQRLGQPGQKRGLKAGQEVLEHARSAYLETEWSGLVDRRLPSGTAAKTKV